MSGEIQIPNSPPGAMTATYFDNNGVPATVIEADQHLHVQVSWQIPQSLANIISPNSDWLVEVFADENGGPFDGPIGNVVVPTVPGQTQYGPVLVHGDVSVFNNPQAGKSSIFETVTALTFRNNGLETELGGFADGPRLRAL
jgi:hypothetical protein